MTHDRLNSGFHTESELIEHDKLVLANNRYSSSEPIQKTICAYPMYTSEGNTRVVVLVNTDSPTIMQEAIARDWSHTRMQPMECKAGRLEWNSDTKLAALYVVLDKYRFTTDIEATTNDRLYKWQSWMDKLL